MDHDQSEPLNAFALHIIGAGRGGTSLLAGLVDAHPRCEIMFEALSQEHLRPPSDGESPEASARHGVAGFLQACQAQARQHPGKVWGHKTTTEHVAALRPHSQVGSFGEGTRGFDPVDHFVQALAHVPTVFIVRDGRTCIRSKVSRTGQTLDMAIGRWKFSIDYLRRLRATHSRLQVVRMEDLVADPVPQLEAVCRLVGIPFDPSMLEGTDNPKMRPDYRRKGLSTDAVAIDEVGPDWLPQIEAEMIYCGYLPPR